jgi:hypothetical protein
LVDEDLDALRKRVQDLARELDAVRRRLERLEARSDGATQDLLGDAETVGPGVEPEPPPTPELAAPGARVGNVALLGRTLMVLAGAYLLRAITDAGFIPGLEGAFAGLAWAAASLVLADRAAGAGLRPSAAFHGVAAAMIAYPLVWETTARFSLLSPGVSALTLVCCLALGLAVAWRRGLDEIAWLNVLFALLAALGLLVRTRDLVSFTAALFLMAALVEGLAFHDRWTGLRWPAAAAVDLALVLVAIVELREGGPPEGYPRLPPSLLAWLGLALAALYLASTTARTLWRGRPIAPFEITQALSALLLGYGGATFVVVSSGGNPTALGVLGLLLGAVGYAAAFSFLERRPEFGRNFYAYSTLGCALTLAGTRIVFSDAWRALAWSALALAAVGLGTRYARMTLKFHGALYALAAALAAGLVAHASDGLLGLPTQTWRSLPAMGGVVLVVAAACYGILARAPDARSESWSRRTPAAICAVLLAWSVAGVAAAWLAGALGAAPGTATDAAVVAAVRTAMLATLAVAVAGAARRSRLLELQWLVYPVLAAGGLKLLVEDLRVGRPATLFVAFALYGAALIATPRLLRND